MKLGLYGVGIGAMAGPQGARIAQLAEDLGYESLWSGEHMALPWPRDPSSHRNPLDPMLDPLLCLTYLAGATQRIRLGTGVLLLPQRHPVHLAKELASLDVLSGGRLIAGVGVGYLDAELRVLGVDRPRRAARSADAIAAVRSMWAAGEATHAGPFYDVSGVVARPLPTRPTGVPIVLGGNSDAALRRAAALGDGWYGFRLTVEQARRATRQLDGRGVDRSRFEVTVTPAEEVDADAVDAYRDAGVDRLVLVAEAPDLGQVEARVRAMAPSRLGLEVG